MAWKVHQCSHKLSGSGSRFGWKSHRCEKRSNPYAWVCLRIWPDNLILSVAAGGDVVCSSFSVGIFYHMERLENK